VRRACALVQIHRSTFHYTTHPTDDSALLTRIQELAAQHPRYGYRRISALINRKEQVNQKRVRRLWRLHRLQVRRVVRKRTRRVRPERLQAAYVGHIWAYDFVEDALADGTTLRILTVMDEFTFLWIGYRRSTDDFGRTGTRRAECAHSSAWRTSVSAQRQWRRVRCDRCTKLAGALWCADVVYRAWQTLAKRKGGTLQRNGARRMLEPASVWLAS
jgi:hypothetical protein